MTGAPLSLPTDNMYLELFGALSARSVRHVVYKGTPKLDDVFDGTSDLDLLVEPSRVGEAVATFLELGYKPSRRLVPVDEPAQWHYFRPESRGRWSHVHLHSQVVCAGQLRTDFVLPSMTAVVLDHVEDHHGVPVPTPSAEYAHLLLKVCTRFASLPDIAMALSGRWRPWPEVRAVRAAAHLDDAVAVLEQSGLEIPRRLLSRCDEVLGGGRITLRACWLGWLMRRRLSKFRVGGPLDRWRDHILLVFDRLLRGVFGGARRVSGFGGLVAAVVGPDAVGKSTLVAGLARRFGSSFQVRVYHGGKPRPTALTLPIRLARLLWRVAKRAESGGGGSVASSSGRPSLVKALNAWALAADRRATVSRAQRSAARGALVLFDRYPSQVPGGMDGPRLESLRTAPGFAGWLSREEASMYGRLTPPDLTLRLTAPVSELMERDRGREDPDGDEYLRTRSAPEAGWGMQAHHREVEIGTGAPPEEVVARAVTEIWSVF